MTLGELLSKNENAETMFHLFNSGETSAFAIVSAGSSSSLSASVSAKAVSSYAVNSPTKVTVTFAAAGGSTTPEDLDGEVDDDF